MYAQTSPNSTVTVRRPVRGLVCAKHQPGKEKHMSNASDKRFTKYPVHSYNKIYVLL